MDGEDGACGVENPYQRLRTAASDEEGDLGEAGSGTCALRERFKIKFIILKAKYKVRVVAADGMQYRRPCSCRGAMGSGQSPGPGGRGRREYIFAVVKSIILSSDAA